jgi:hypothetical protein
MDMIALLFSCFLKELSLLLQARYLPLVDSSADKEKCLPLIRSEPDVFFSKKKVKLIVIID